MTAPTAPVSAETVQAPLDAARQSIEARLRAGGFVLLELADSTFIVSRWGHVRPLPDLFAASRFAEHSGL